METVDTPRKSSEELSQNCTCVHACVCMGSRCNFKVSVGSVANVHVSAECHKGRTLWLQS